MEYMASMQLKSPKGISRSSKRHGRKPGKTACSACHARKKRCDIARPHTQCMNCRKGDQVCFPRSPVKSPQYSKDDRSCDQSYQTLDLPLPHGVDHEVPRWSALYSVYSEIRRLLPFVGKDDSDLDHIGSPLAARLESYPDLYKIFPGEGSTDHSLYQEEQLSLQYANISHIKGICMPASGSPSSSSSRNQTDSGHVAWLHRAGTEESSVLDQSYYQVIRDLVTDNFMDDLDKLLVF